MLRLFLLRHGETDWNRDRRIMGPEDIPLNTTGLEQARAFRSQLAECPFDQIFSSPILRAQETAEVVAKGFDLQPQYDARLEEVGYGEWVGRTFKEVREQEGYVPYFKRLDTPVAPGGESLYQVRDRAMAFMKDCAEKYPDQNVLAVTHADWIKCLLLEVLGVSLEFIWKIRIDNGSVSLVECHEKAPIVICINQRQDLTRLFKGRPWF